jgi:hypothetical protein
MLAPSSPQSLKLNAYRRHVHGEVVPFPGVLRASDLVTRPDAAWYANWLRCIDKAVERARELRRYARQVSPTHYIVKSQDKPGVRYHVYLLDGGYLQCTCPAGDWGRPCKHAARVALRRQREYRMPRLSDLPETPYELFDGDELDLPTRSTVIRRVPSRGNFHRVA